MRFHELLKLNSYRADQHNACKQKILIKKIVNKK
jgi:hypothetical protein